MAIADRIALLNGGRVEQEGTPTELYGSPATLFAAEFMGNNNVIAGTLVENDGGKATIETIGCRISGTARTHAAIGETAHAVIRSERTRIGGGPGPNRIPMKLSTQMYLGERWEIVFAGEGLNVRAYASTPLKHEAYHVELPPDAVWVF
jgi:iron(III) transport system ATP-binding protein